MSLSIANLSISFDGIDTLKDISFTASDHEFVSIIGPSGCGKSTLFSTIGGLLTPDRGTIHIDGKLANGKRGFVGYMPQEASLFGWRTVLENAQFAMEIEGRLDGKKVEELLEIAGVLEYKNLYPNALSGGMKQRVSFVRAMLSHSSILLLDEPFSALDGITRASMQEWLLEFYKREKKTILLITHDIDEAIFLSNKIVILSSAGEIIKIITKELDFDKSDRLSSRFIEIKRIISSALTAKNHYNLN